MFLCVRVATQQPLINITLPARLSVLREIFYVLYMYIGIHAHMQEMKDDRQRAESDVQVCW